MTNVGHSSKHSNKKVKNIIIGNMYGYKRPVTEKKCLLSSYYVCFTYPMFNKELLTTFISYSFKTYIASFVQYLHYIKNTDN